MTARLKTLDPAAQTGQLKEKLDAVQKKLGMVPNLLRVMANSPAVLDTYIGVTEALAGSRLRPAMRERLALVVAEANQCDYCLAAHSAVGRMLGLNDQDVADARRATSPDSRTGAALSFARTLVDQRGKVSDAELDKLRAAGFDDGEIAEIVTTVAFNIFTNYMNHVAATDIDFPAAAELTVA